MPPLNLHHVLLLFLLSLALCANSALTGDSAQFQDAHNDARARVGAGALNWNGTLAAKAREMVRQQRNLNSCTVPPLPQNAWYAANMGTSRYDEEARGTVQRWAAVGSHYHHDMNTCDKGWSCNSYLQVVWCGTVEVGCSRATCINRAGRINVCLYYPPGNVAGQRPY